MIQKNNNLVPVITGISFAPVSDIDTMEQGTDRFRRVVTFLSQKDWIPVYFTPGTAELVEKPKDNDAGELFEISLKFLFPGDDEATLAALDPMTDRPVVVRIGYDHGGVKVIGSPENPARLQQSFQHTAKVAGCQFEFGQMAECRAPWLDE